jgi:hypothetical protein
MPARISPPFRFVASFILHNARAGVVVASQHLNPEPYVSFTGDYDGGAGQIDLRKAAADLPETVDASAILELCALWDQLHLKRFDTLDAAQLEALETVPGVLSRLDGRRFGVPDAIADVDSADFSNASDVIDSRDIIRRIETLNGALEGAGYDLAGLTLDAPDFGIAMAEDADGRDLAEELCKLRALEDDADRAADWKHGVTLIRDSYFETYAEEFADDIGATDRNATWPLNHINWTSAANELKTDYFSVAFDGVTYWVR